MSSSSSSKVDKSGERSWKCSDTGSCGGKWSGKNIFFMVLGFVFFWPVGLVILFWILSGRNVSDLPAAVKQKWADFSGKHGGEPESASDNTVFNAYQQTQYDRISEIKEEIKSRARRFREFRADAKRRADDEEFNQFMANNPGRES
uniref:DUF2852 domain-containing protein n=1 Tax=uncultured Thiotrichaceae bacterium TaxID=298394 RepID=A0A6S6UKN5_9GAMM|nr:MAG: Unknown protein [uncultured Thiotrichaceae bacterium]